MYSKQVWPLRGLKVEYSLSEQVTSVLARPAASMPLMRYVNGETRYMKIQKPGRVPGPARTLNSQRQIVPH